MLTLFPNSSGSYPAEKTAGSFFEKALELKMATPELSANVAQEIPNRLADFINAQETAIGKVEPRFLQLGQELQTLYSEASELTQYIRKSIEGIGGGKSDESVLATLGQLVTDSLTKIGTCQTEISTNLQQVDVIVEQLDKFYGMCPVLEKIAQFLRVVGLNICIECSQSREATEMFMNNADEIKKFSENVIEITEKIREDSQNARTSLISVHGKISAGLSQVQGLADNATRVVQEAYHKIEDLMELSLAATEQAEAHSGEISRQVGEIVVGIQFHDSMSQRIEHINTALYDAASRCGQSFVDESNNQKSEELTAVHSITALQAGQFREIILGIEKVYQQNRQAFEEISNEVDSLASTLLTLTSGNGQAASSSQGKDDDPFAALQLALFQLKGLLDQGGNLVTQIEEAAVQASETASLLLGHMEHMRAISYETLIKSLNSIVKASRLGEKGRTIEVLANEITKLSDQSNAFVADVEKIHESISSSITELRDQPQEREDDLLHNTVSLDVAIENIICAYDQFMKDSDTALQRADALKNGISLASANLDFLPALGCEFTENLQKLEEVEEQLSPWAGQFNGEAADADILAERYTMEHERIVHQQLFDGAEKSIDMFEMTGEGDEDEDNKATLKEMVGSSSMIVSDGEEKEDDLGDNIELF